MSESMVYLSIVRDLKRKKVEELARPYQTFESVEEMDRHLRDFIICHGLKLSESALRVLEYLVRHSLKVIGVSWLSIKSISELAGLSSRSVQRILKHLEEMHIVKRVETVKEHGGQGVNLIVIQPPDNKSLNVAEKCISDYQEAASASIDPSVEGELDYHVTPINKGNGAANNTQNLSNLKSFDDGIYKSHYRYLEYFKLAEEKGIPREIAKHIFPAIREQLHTTSWTALYCAFAELKKRATTISSIAPWFASTLRTKNMLDKIAYS